MDNANVSLDRSFPSIFDDEDNVYNTCPVNGDLRPSSRARKERMEASTRTDTPSRRRSWLEARESISGLLQGQISPHSTFLMSQDRKLQIVTALLDGVAWELVASPEEMAELDVMEVMELVPAFMR